MTAPLTPAQARDLVERTWEAISYDHDVNGDPKNCPECEDRARLTSDLAGMEDAHKGLARHSPYEAEGVTCENDCLACERGDGHMITARESCTDWEGGVFAHLCSDAARYTRWLAACSGGIERTARKYGVTR